LNDLPGMVMSRVFVAVLLCGWVLPSEADAQTRARKSRRMRLVATAYCDHGITDSGAPTRRGTLAADPRVFPMGSVVKIESNTGYSGTYTVADTGAKIKGRKVDIFVPSCAQAKSFGKRLVVGTLVRRPPAEASAAR
jgi:3D (Asp-Asp-Asp) domain-containing protein